MLFGIELLIDVDIHVHRKGRCGGYAAVPLPSGRDLWEPVLNEEWVERFHEIETPSEKTGLPSIYDLRASRHSLANSLGAVRPHDKQADMILLLSKWCERLDDFGMMVWMAVMLDGE